MSKKIKIPYQYSPGEIFVIERAMLGNKWIIRITEDGSELYLNAEDNKSQNDINEPGWEPWADKHLLDTVWFKNEEEEEQDAEFFLCDSMEDALKELETPPDPEKHYTNHQPTPRPIIELFCSSLTAEQFYEVWDEGRQERTHSFALSEMAEFAEAYHEFKQDEERRKP